MWFSLSKVYLAQYFELNNIPFGQLVYWSVVNFPRFPKDHISGEICKKNGKSNIFRTRNIIEGKVFYMRTTGYFVDPVFIYLFYLYNIIEVYTLS